MAATFRDARGLAIRENLETLVLFNVDEGTFEREGGNRTHKIDPAFKLGLRTAEVEQREDSVGGIRFFPRRYVDRWAGHAFASKFRLYCDGRLVDGPGGHR